MITDDILGRPNFRRKYNPSRKPILKAYQEQPSKLDPELRRLRHVMLRPTADNREYCFWVSSIAQSGALIADSTTTGDGLRIRSTNKEAKDIITGWNQEININGESIEDYFQSSWIDEINHAGSYWRAENFKDLAYKIDIQRLDPKTLICLRDPKYGWKLYIQQVNNFKAYRSKTSFYRNAGVNDDVLRLTYPYKTMGVRIQDEPDVLLRTNFFIRPPISTAVQYIGYKRFILYFMRKYAQRLWTPFLLFLVGDPKTNYYPDNPDEMQEAIDDLSEIIPLMSSFGGAAVPGNVIVNEIGKNTARSSEVFVTYMEALDKQIMMAIFGSMGLREASGNELATSRTLREGWLQFLKGIRRKRNTRLIRFYTKCLLPAHGIKLSNQDVNIEWSPLKFEASEEYMRAIESAYNIGAFKDLNELRKATQTILPWLEPVSSGQNKKIPFPPQKATTTSTNILERFGIK